MKGTFQLQTSQRAARCHLSLSVAPEALLSIRQWIGTTLVPAGGADLGTASAHPFAVPISSPASRAWAPASPASPACSGVAAVPAARPGLPCQAPQLYRNPGALQGVGVGVGAGPPEGEAGDLGASRFCAPGRRPRRAGQGRGGQWRGGHRSSVTPVTSGATRLPASVLPADCATLLSRRGQRGCGDAMPGPE